jgi:hypothetical protein
MAPVKKALESLWEAVELKPATHFAAYVSTASKAQELRETLQLVPRKDFERLGSALKSRIELALEDESLWDVADGDPAMDTDGCLILRAVTKIVSYVCEDDKAAHQYMVEAAVALHGLCLFCGFHKRFADFLSVTQMCCFRCEKSGHSPLDFKVTLCACASFGGVTAARSVMLWHCSRFRIC